MNTDRPSREEAEVRQEPDNGRGRRRCWLPCWSVESHGPWPDALLQLCRRLDFRALGTAVAGFEVVRLPVGPPAPPTTS
ncbi:hypothetical protein [Micromonospora qiuiae]|uniref:hypothetical protein n=1 Tax=Micromonospora qiuiae TaxID=502268 RepID=UPI00195129F0|nr:hypothetical protein [Micromonospora qiuiae]